MRVVTAAMSGAEEYRTLRPCGDREELRYNGCA